MQSTLLSVVNVPPQNTWSDKKKQKKHVNGYFRGLETANKVGSLIAATVIRKKKQRYFISIHFAVLWFLVVFLPLVWNWTLTEAISQNACMCLFLLVRYRRNRKTSADSLKKSEQHYLIAWGYELACFFSPFDMFVYESNKEEAGMCVCVCVVCLCMCAHASSVNLEPQHYSSSHVWRRVALAATMSSWVPPSVLVCIVGNACSPDSVTAVHSHRITSQRYSPPPFTYTRTCVLH